MRMMTDEQHNLFTRFIAEEPEVALDQAYDAVGICVVNDKRVLCLHFRDIDAFLHYHPEGLTDEERAAVIRGHGMDGVMSRDPDSGAWESVRIRAGR